MLYLVDSVSYEDQDIALPIKVIHNLFAYLNILLIICEVMPTSTNC